MKIFMEEAGYSSFAFETISINAVLLCRNSHRIILTPRRKERKEGKETGYEL
jgi:hypothetical protein